MTNASLNNVGMGLQKLGINGLKEVGEPSRRGAWIAVWNAGLLIQIIVLLLGAKALSIGNASTLGGFAGTGLVALAIFSHFILKEHISRRELAGLGLILVGTSMLGFFSSGHQSSYASVDSGRMVVFFAAYFGLVALSVVLMLRDIDVFGGVVLGAIGGTLGGLGMVFMKIVVNKFQGADPFAAATLAAFLTSGYTWVMAVGGIGGVVLVQLGYKYGKAIQVVPGFASMVVITPTLAGVAILHEPVPAVCILSLAVITVGVLIGTTAPRITEESIA